MVEGVRGTGNEGDIAVDDVILLEGNCAKAVNQGILFIGLIVSKLINVIMSARYDFIVLYS